MSSVESYSDVESNTDGGGDWLAAESSASLFVILSGVRTFSEPLNIDICKIIKGEYRLEVIDEARANVLSSLERHACPVHVYTCSCPRNNSLSPALQSTTVLVHNLRRTHRALNAGCMGAVYVERWGTYLCKLRAVTRTAHTLKGLSCQVEMIVSSTLDVSLLDNRCAVLYVVPSCRLVSLERAHAALTSLTKTGVGVDMALSEQTRLCEASEQAVLEQKTSAQFSGLDDSQQLAVEAACRRYEWWRKNNHCNFNHCIQGPPGTGKSTVAATLVRALLARGSRVLVTAYSNAAIAVLARHLVTAQDLRLGDLVWVTAEDHLLVGNLQLQHQQLDTRVEAIVTAWLSVECRSDSDKRDELHKILPIAPKSIADEILAFLRNSRAYISDRCELALRDRSTLRNVILRDASCILATTTIAGRPEIQYTLEAFDAVVCDEAAQAPKALFAVLLTHRTRFFTHIGDHKQLGPVVQSTLAAQRGFGRSYFEEFVSLPGMSVVTVQRRSVPALVEFNNVEFYEERVQHSPAVAAPAYVQQLWPLAPVTLFDVGGEESTSGVGGQLQNKLEARACITILRAFESCLPHEQPPVSVVVLTPYAGQQRLIQQQVNHEKFNARGRITVGVYTIDAFQGREADMVIFSTVRCNPLHDIGFCSDPRRFNVATTRARYAMCVVTSVETFSTDPLYHKFFLHVQRASPASCVNCPGPPKDGIKRDNGQEATFTPVTTPEEALIARGRLHEEVQRVVRAEARHTRGIRSKGKKRQREG
jgi:hypothetical protein